MKSLLLAAALALPLAALAQGSALIDITDPEGDDVGDGTLVYPRDTAFAPGDLDLRGLRVFSEGDGLRFEARFRNTIRHPSTVKAGGLGSEDLSLFARRGFYSFNIDIYIDTDRVAGSGRTDTLPGRSARIAREHAWEKAIVLTPRPELMRRQLQDAQAESAPSGQAAAVAGIDPLVFFATDVRVSGRSVSFTVPKSFLGSLNAADWSLTTIVTVAKLQIEAGFTLGKAGAGTADHFTLGVQPPAAGRPEYAMGYGGERAPATAIVDLLAPGAGQQAAQLAAGAQLIGLNRDNRFGTAMTLPAAPAPAPAVTPAAAPVPVPAPARPTPPVAAVPTPAAPPATAPRPAVASSAPSAPAPAASATAPRTRDAAFFEEQELRLRTLKRLRDGGLISEDEYHQKRREILEKL